MDKTKIKNLIFLHLILLIYSFGGIFSKMAANQSFMSLKFIIFYSLLLMILFAYAILWQQVLKRMPLTVAFANKSIIIIWGILWGILFFKEEISIGMIIGSIIIIYGIYLVVSDHE